MPEDSKTIPADTDTNCGGVVGWNMTLKPLLTSFDPESVKRWILRTHGHYSPHLTLEENVINALRCLKANGGRRHDFKLAKVWRGFYEAAQGRLDKLRAVHGANKVRRHKLRIELDRANAEIARLRTELARREDERRRDG